MKRAPSPFRLTAALCAAAAIAMLATVAPAGAQTPRVNTAAPPASTTVEIPRLAREGALIEVEAIAVLPAR